LWNVRSINNKCFQVLNYLESKDIDIFFITETWITDLNNASTKILTEDNNYILFNLPRSGDKRGGGVAIMVRSNLKCTPFRSFKFSSMEVLGLTLSSGCSNTRLICVYRKDAIPFTTFCQEFETLLLVLLESPDATLICGDFNIHFNNRSHAHTIKFCDITDHLGFSTAAIPPTQTHVLGNTIDFVITDTPSAHSVSGVVVDYDTFGTSTDHFPVLFSLDVPAAVLQDNPARSIWRRNFKDIDIHIFKSDLNLALLTALDDHTNYSFEELYHAFDEAVTEVRDQHAPLIEYRSSSKDVPWMDAEYRAERRCRRRLEEVYNKSRLPEDKLLRDDQRSFCCLLANKKRSDYYKFNISLRAGDQRALYSFVNNLLDNNQKPKLPDYSTPDVVAGSLNTFFVDKIDNIHNTISDTNYMNTLSSKINNNISPNSPPSSPPFDSSSGFYLSEFDPCSEEEVTEMIKECGMKSCSLDPLPADLLKQCTSDLIPAFTVLINASLSTGKIDGVKQAHVIPILKKAGLDPNIFNNLRPVSNLPLISKLTERVVAKRLNSHMTTNKLNIDSQYGYKKGCGTETLLVHFLDNLMVGIDQKLGVVVLLIDLSAAFDTVDHGILLNILHRELGIRGTALNWFKSFLSGRTQRVCIGDIISEPIILKYGVPQGSVLGPILFNIYTRSLVLVFIACGFVSSGYADDNSGSRSFSVLSEFETLVERIPSLLSMIKSWMDFHFLKLNEDKTEIIIFGNRTFLNRPIQIKGCFTTSGTCLRFSDTVRYLGVHLDSHLNFDSHINHITSSSYIHIRKIRSIRKYLSQADCEMLVHAFISSRLDMCNILFVGMSAINLDKLQKLQNAAIRIIFQKKKNESVSDDIKSLHWLNIRQRITFKVLLTVYKLLHCDDAPATLLDLIRVKDPSTLQLEVNTFFPATNFGKRAFRFFAPRQWNSLPATLRTTTGLETFKGQLKHHLFAHFDSFCQQCNKYDT